MEQPWARFYHLYRSLRRAEHHDKGVARGIGEVGSCPVQRTAAVYRAAASWNRAGNSGRLVETRDAFKAMDTTVIVGRAMWQYGACGRARDKAEATVLLINRLQRDPYADRLAFKAWLSKRVILMPGSRCATAWGLHQHVVE